MPNDRAARIPAEAHIGFVEKVNNEMNINDNNSLKDINHDFKTRNQDCTKQVGCEKIKFWDRKLEILGANRLCSLSAR